MRICLFIPFSSYLSLLNQAENDISSQLRIIIRQEYRQEHRNGKGTSHADNQELAEVFTSIHSLYPIPGICHEYKSRQGFYGLRYGWLLYCLGLVNSTVSGAFSR